MKNLRIQCSPITGVIYAGRINKDGTAWAGAKTNVTSDVLGAIIQKIGAGNIITVDENGMPAFEIEVRTIAPAAESAPPETAKEACWCHRCHDGKPRVQMIVCPTCGNKRCPHASDHALICTGSNAQGQRGSIYGKPERCPPETT